MITYMKTICIFFLVSIFTMFTHAEDICATGKITYKSGANNIVSEVEMCKNEYSQFYSKKCSDGCDFAKALKENKDLEVTDSVVGSPGGQICALLKFQSFIVEIEFNGAKSKNLDLCFNKDKSAFVSTGFLRDLAGDL